MRSFDNSYIRQCWYQIWPILLQLCWNKISWQYPPMTDNVDSCIWPFPSMMMTSNILTIPTHGNADIRSSGPTHLWKYFAISTQQIWPFPPMTNADIQYFGNSHPQCCWYRIFWQFQPKMSITLAIVIMNILAVFVFLPLNCFHSIMYMPSFFVFFLNSMCTAWM